MDIYELENLRKNTLKEIDDLKPFVILGTFIIPSLVLIIFHYSGYDVKSASIPIAFILCLPMIFYVADIFELDKTPQIKYMLFARITPMIFFTIATNLAEKYLKFFYIVVIIFTIFSMNLIYKMCMKSIKKSKQKKYQKEFKIQSLKPYLAEFGYDYNENGLIENMYLRHSKIFRESVHYIESGNDKICGKVDGIKFTFVDIALVDTIKKYDIYGVFFHASFNKKANSNLFVISNDATNDNAKQFKKITMDNIEFNAKFSVYSNDLQNAMYILSPAFMKRLLDLKRRLNFPISVSFAGDKIYIFLDTGKDNFEPDIDKSVLHANPAFTIKRELSHFLSIVKTLNLNTRIWKV
ncbi:DUF3137 domain-containing protein [Campylobacter sp. JMF_09 ED2]|uniref:DUF3137 domain-containing protein n=1 Tax=Campylobacter sp. JMF_09 ED2 TaxID=2983837 RepID=UPI0022E99C26|nr:DUF3137 domain-containing protein [Campylobacter sp. JMF_09 ED2]MDA3043469.1 DUF3137 domain-containing protein [Campylobacter sp. JMF_09 ED2]